MKQVSFGFTDTPISGVTSLDLPRGLVNFGADFRVVSNKPGEAIITNLTSPVDRPEKFRTALTTVSNIYANTGISPSVQASNLKGSNLLVQLNEVISITDTTDLTFRVDAPISAHLVLKVPAIEQITEEHILTVFGRLVSGLFETGSESPMRLKAELRGALLPSDI